MKKNKQSYKISNFSQEELKHLDYDTFLMKELERDAEQIPEDAVTRIITLLALITGIPVSNILRLRWRDLFYFGSDDLPTIYPSLCIRKHTIPTHPAIKWKLVQHYEYAGYPNLNSRITEHINSPWNKSTPNLILRQIRRLDSYWREIDEKRINQLDFTKALQIAFGRKVLSVNGHNNDVFKRLKNHFRLTLNDELLDFLGLETAPIHYGIHNINLDVTNLVQLKDRNFNNGYEFQQFDVFNRFLSTKRSHKETACNRSIKILLLISLYNGVRPTSLLGLNWQDIYTFVKPKNKRKVKKSTQLNGKTIKIPLEAARLLGSHINEGIDMNWEFETRHEDFKKTEIDIANKINHQPPLPVFFTNRNNRIASQSLLREIKNTLRVLGFRHTDKFKLNSTILMFGRKVIEVKGNHKTTVYLLKHHLKYSSVTKMFRSLKIDYKNKKGKWSFEFEKDEKERSVKGVRHPLFEEPLYELPNDYFKKKQ